MFNAVRLCFDGAMWRYVGGGWPYCYGNFFWCIATLVRSTVSIRLGASPHNSFNSCCFDGAMAVSSFNNALLDLRCWQDDCQMNALMILADGLHKTKQPLLQGLFCFWRDSICDVCSWSECRDSNSRPLGPEPSAIPSFATPRKYYAVTVQR